MTISYASLHDTLTQLNVPISVSEAHGVLCGLLCVQPSDTAKSRWFVEVLEAAGLEPSAIASQAAAIKHLDAWFTETLTAVNDPDMAFLPATPDESTGVTVRMQGLADFCSGFTYGFALAGAYQGDQLPEDTRDIITDFQAISSADPIDDVDENGEMMSRDEQEALYTELLEYARVGVLLTLEELRPVSPAKHESLN